MDEFDPMHAIMKLRAKAQKNQYKSFKSEKAPPLSEPPSQVVLIDSGGAGLGTRADNPNDPTYFSTSTSVTVNSRISYSSLNNNVLITDGNGPTSVSDASNFENNKQNSRLSTIMKEVCMWIIPISALLVGVALVTIIAINKAGFLQNFQLLGNEAEIRVYADASYTWYGAEEFCKKKGGQLAKLDTPYLSNLIQEKLQEATATYKSAFWIGLSEKSLNDGWYWTDGQPVGNTNWNSKTEGSKLYYDTSIGAMVQRNRQVCVELRKFFGSIVEDRYTWSAQSCQNVNYLICTINKQRSWLNF